jgi:hypothetical protein
MQHINSSDSVTGTKSQLAVSSFKFTYPSAMPAESISSPPAALPVVPVEAGKGGVGGDLAITNAEFISAVFPACPAGAYAAVCSKAGDPQNGGWLPQRADQVADKLSATRNHYVNCSSFRLGADGSFKARKADFAACHFILLDDIGTKIPFERLGGFEFSWLIETSPGNHQGGIILNSPVTDGAVAEQLLDAIIEAKLCDEGARQPMTRWARLPVAINGKPKYADESGKPFQCRLVEWHPERRYTVDEIFDGLGLERSSGEDVSRNRSRARNDVLRPGAVENPVVMALKARGLYKTPLGGGKHDITCPWVSEHTDQLDGGTAYFEPDDQFPVGGFCCQHSHGSRLHLGELLKFLEIDYTEARDKFVIQVNEGELNRVVSEAEQVLAAGGKHYQCGNLIASIATDLNTGDPAIVPLNPQALTRELSIAAEWVRWGGEKKGWIRCDPPPRHVSILYETQNFRYLPPLIGVVRQPYFRESDGQLVVQPGYDRVSQRFGVFNTRQFVIPDPTPDAARLALALLEELLAEFHFVSDVDKAAALSAMFTAVVRQSLEYAPAFHVRAPVFGSGKSYLCDLIGAFAGPGGNAKVSYPTTTEEATKVIHSLLLTNPAVIEFDDMDTDWIPHGIIKRMLTAERLTDRILGFSKTATVSTRTLFLGSGNNVGPIRDLLRRVLTIHIDSRTATPATMTYRGNPLEKVRKERGKYVSAVLTIIQAWRQIGSPRGNIESIVTYSGAWSEYCRHPLIWLGHADPATALINQVRHDPDGEALLNLLTEWHKAFGSTPTTVRSALESFQRMHHTGLQDAMREFPIEDRNGIIPSKLGWLLRKNANRIVKGYEFQRAEADGRTAWRVVRTKPSPAPDKGAPPSPELPPAGPSRQQ